MLPREWSGGLAPHSAFVAAAEARTVLSSRSECASRDYQRRGEAQIPQSPGGTYGYVLVVVMEAQDQRRKSWRGFRSHAPELLDACDAEALLQIGRYCDERPKPLVSHPGESLCSIPGYPSICGAVYQSNQGWNDWISIRAKYMKSPEGSVRTVIPNERSVLD